MTEAIVVIASGGIDSTVLLHDVLRQGYAPHVLSFNYGQKHVKELSNIIETCKGMGVPYKLIDITAINDLLQGSSLTTDDIETPAGRYDAPSMKVTVVPNRNPIFLNLALGYALSIGATKIMYAAHAGDHHIYADCREPFLTVMNDLCYIWDSDGRGELSPEWVRAFIEAEGCFTHGKGEYTKNKIAMPVVAIAQKERKILEKIRTFFYGRGYITTNGDCYMYRLATYDCKLVIDLMQGRFRTKRKEQQFIQWYDEFKDYFEHPCRNTGKPYTIQNITLVAPYVNFKKHDVVALGIELGVDFTHTWTCYKGKERACGRCGTCTERIEAFKICGIIDPIEYELDIDWEDCKEVKINE